MEGSTSRKEIVDFLSTEMPDDWYAIPEAEVKMVDDIIDAVTSIEPLTKEEALAVASRLPNDDLAGGGQTLCHSIASAPEWPYQMAELLYVDKFSDPLSDIKSESFQDGINYHFQSEPNKNLSFNFKNYAVQLKSIREGISRVDCQILIAFFLHYSRDGLEPSLHSMLQEVIVNFFAENPSARKEILEDSYQAESLMRLYEMSFG